MYFFSHFLLDIISRSRYHIISYQHIFHGTFSSFPVNWEITKLMSIWNEFNGFFSSLFFFLYSLQTGSGKTYKGSRVNLHVLQEDYSSKKTTQYWKEKKNIKKFKGMQEFFLNPLLSLEDPTILKFASITLSHSFYPQSQNI